MAARSRKVVRKIDETWRAIVRAKLSQHGAQAKLIRALKDEKISVAAPTISMIVTEDRDNPKRINSSELVDDIDRILEISYPPHMWQRLGERVIAQPDTLAALTEWMRLGDELLELDLLDDAIERVSDIVIGARAATAKARRDAIDTTESGTISKKRNRSEPLRIAPSSDGDRASDRTATTAHGLSSRSRTR